jgi:uncharacterized protein YktB (UPF0637 family)
MRKIFQIDGLDSSMLSIGERNQPQQAAICLRDSQGNETNIAFRFHLWKTNYNDSKQIRFY